MKIKHPKKRGFALVATLTLMMLLGLIAVGILAVASSQNRIAAQTILLAQARQQAILGLDAAISDLQMELGPDQRVTASSGILSENPSNPQHILGVWNSWRAPLYGKSEGKDIKSTYEGIGRNSMFRRWLISCRDQDVPRQISAINDIGKPQPGRRICIVGEGTLGTKVSKDEYVYADLITMPSSDRNETCYAWWISGENQKANVAIQDRPATSDPVEILHRTWDTPAPVFKDSSNLNFLPENINEPQKLVNLKTLPLLNRGSSDPGQPYFFDVTTYSYSLITNVRDGGLKLDLNLLLNKKDLNNTPLRPRSDQDCPIAEGEGLPTGTEAIFPIGSWQVLHAFYNTWPDGTGEDEDFTSNRMHGGVASAYTRMVGHLPSSKIKTYLDRTYDVTYFSDRTSSDTEDSGYARTPIMLSFIAKFGIWVGPPQVTRGDGGAWENGGYMSYGYSYTPNILLWNPYNVPLRVSPKKLWSFSLPYRVGNFTYRLYEKPNADTSWCWNIWSRLIQVQPIETGGQHVDDPDHGYVGQRDSLGNDWGNYFVVSKSDQTSDIVFEPGEILMFCMSEGQDNAQKERRYTYDGIDYHTEDGVKWVLNTPQDIPFVLGDQVGYIYNSFSGVNRPHVLPDDFSGQVRIRFAFETKKSFTSITRDWDFDIQYWKEQFLSKQQTLVSSDLKQAHATSADFLGPHARGAFVVPHGYNGIEAAKVVHIVEKSSNIEEAFPTASVDAYAGAKGISPYNFMLGWFDYDEETPESLTFAGGDGQEEMVFKREMYSGDATESNKEPTYFAAVGVAPKGYNNSLTDALSLFQGKDYRTKTWQHSCPAMGGGYIYKPNDQQRQYHPFQLAAFELQDRTGTDTVNSKNGIYGIQNVGVGGGEGVSFISVLELPVHPPFSLAGFSGMRLKPGWYGDDDFSGQNSLSQMRRMQYQAGVPGVGIGNSFADPCLPSDGVYAFHETKINSDLQKNARIFSDFYDHGFIINDALWDRWFCSSVSDMPDANGRISARETLSAFAKGEQPLPVSRYKLAPAPTEPDRIVSRIMEEDGWKEIARYLMVEGGFNVNSVSEDAWAAVLQGLAKRELVSNTDSHLHMVEHNGKDNVLFPRFMVSTADRTMDGTGNGYNMLLGAAFLRPSLKMATAWGDVRSLTSDQIRQLAREMVKKVRERGPFLNMSDFINRRLDGGTEAALTGALQAAIDATDINDELKRADFLVQPLAGDFYSFPRAEEGSMYTAAPGYLIQSDVLMSLGNILTVRDDTFTVRAYGCVRNSRHAILAQAWCEAVVQRTIEYVDPNNSPTDGSYDPANQGASTNSNLSEVNRLMGRKMKIVSFKWLDAWNI